MCVAKHQSRTLGAAVGSDRLPPCPSSLDYFFDGLRGWYSHLLDDWDVDHLGMAHGTHSHPVLRQKGSTHRSKTPAFSNVSITETSSDLSPQGGIVRRLSKAR